MPGPNVFWTRVDLEAKLLDFSMVSEKGYAGMEWMSKVKRDLSLAGFDPHLTWNDRKVVHTGWIRLAGILYDAGISGAFSGCITFDAGKFVRIIFMHREYIC